MKIHQGDIYWLTLQTGPNQNTIPHPYVVFEIELDELKVIRITTNMKKISWPSSILLEKGEANLEKKSIIDTSQQLFISKNQLGKFIGSLENQRIIELSSKIELIENLTSNSI